MTIYEKVVEKHGGHDIMTTPYPIMNLYLRRDNMLILTFRLSVFGDFRRFAPTTSNTIAWTQALQKEGYNFLPNIFQMPQQVVNTPVFSVQVGSNDNRIQFVSQSGDVSMRILPERLDIEFTQGTTDRLKEYFEGKLQDAVRLMGVMLNTLDPELRGNRLAYYVETLIPEQDNNQFSPFYQRNNLDIKMGNGLDECTEWNHRFNRRIMLNVCSDAEELCNAIFSLESGVLQSFDPATKEQQTIKGLHIISDINTLAENALERFGIDNFNRFTRSAQNTYYDIIEQIENNIFRD